MAAQGPTLPAANKAPGPLIGTLESRPCKMMAFQVDRREFDSAPVLLWTKNSNEINSSFIVAGFCRRVVHTSSSGFAPRVLQRPRSRPLFVVATLQSLLTSRNLRRKLSQGRTVRALATPLTAAVISADFTCERSLLELLHMLGGPRSKKNFLPPAG